MGLIRDAFAETFEQLKDEFSDVKDEIKGVPDLYKNELTNTWEEAKLSWKEQWEVAFGNRRKRRALKKQR